MADSCVFCGRTIPEGNQECGDCARGFTLDGKGDSRKSPRANQSEREQAARVLEGHSIQISDNRRGYCIKIRATDFTEMRNAIDIAIACLRGQGWVRTAERMPTEADADEDGNVLVQEKFWVDPIVLKYQEVIEHPELSSFWMKIPALPEVDNV